MGVKGPAAGQRQSKRDMNLKIAPRGPHKADVEPINAQTTVLSKEADIPRCQHHSPSLAARNIDVHILLKAGSTIVLTAYHMNSKIWGRVTPSA